MNTITIIISKIAHLTAQYNNNSISYYEYTLKLKRLSKDLYDITKVEHKHGKD